MTVLAAACIAGLGIGTAASAVGPPPKGGPSGQEPGVTPLVAPANDNFASAASISGASGCQAETNVDATLETGEPRVVSFDQNSVWYSWTAPSTGTFSFRVFPRSMVDSTLGIYTGTLGSLTDEGSNDDTYGFGSQVDLAATISTTYMIRVAAYSTGDDGTFALEWGGGCTPPANDDFANATTATGTSGSLTSQTNEAATLQSGELDTHGLCTDNGPCAATSDLGGASVWYAWTAPSNQTNFEVCVDLTSGGANLWPVLGVYTGSLGSLTEVAYGDFATSGGCDTKVSFNAASGTTYMFGVGGEFGSTGGFDLSWTTDSTPPDTDIAGQTNLTNQSPVTFDVTFSEPVSGFDNNDVDLSSSSASTGTVTVTDTGDHAHYTVDVVVTSQGAVTASIPAASAVDGANNSSNASGSAMIVYDSTDPSLSVTTIKVQGAKVTVTFAASDSNGIDDTLCKLDSGSYASCGSPYVRELPKGSHTFYVRALDAAGNQADTSTAFTIRSGKIKI